MRTQQNITGVHKQHYLIVLVDVIVRIFIDVGVLDGFGQIFRCDTQYDIHVIQVLTYCEKTDKKQSLSYRRCS